MIEITAWKCKWCNKLFRTPDRHRCKKNPVLKNCFSCKHLMGWTTDGEDFHIEGPPRPVCAVDDGDRWDWDIENIKDMNYDMQCKGWEEGSYDWEKRWKKAVACVEWIGDASARETAFISSKKGEENHES